LDLFFIFVNIEKCLKNEPYFDNSLTRFLLKRAWKSERIGFDFFWNLKSDITKNSRYSKRFGVLLEAYCRGLSKSQLNLLLKQVECVEKLSLLCQEIKSNPDYISLVKVCVDFNFF
jgi:phosphatidylinositol-4,5-bisphosphate 3-kinase